MRSCRSSSEAKSRTAAIAAMATPQPMMEELGKRRPVDAPESGVGENSPRRVLRPHLRVGEFVASERERVWPGSTQLHTALREAISASSSLTRRLRRNLPLMRTTSPISTWSP